jgi:hypothetical protein
MVPFIAPRRQQRPTAAQRDALVRLAAGGTIGVVSGDYFIGDLMVHRPVVVVLVTRGWATLPQPALPLFNLPAQPGLITDAGRAAIRSAKNED